VADRIREILRLGPAEALRRSFSRRSSFNTCSRVFCGLGGTGLFVAAPGLESAPEALADLASFCFGLEIVTGPPSFLLITAQRSGRRDEKLEVLLASPSSRRNILAYNGVMISIQKSRGILSECLGALVDDCETPAISLPISDAMDCQMHKRSI